MKIILDVIPQSSIDEFAKRHDLEIFLVEREVQKDSPMRYYAYFKSCSIKDGTMLIGEIGNGNTPEQAIDDYARNIELKVLVYDAYGEDRREIKVPRLF